METKHDTKLPDGRCAHCYGATGKTHILRSQDERWTWRRYQVITDGKVRLIHLFPSFLGGWKVAATEVQGHDRWEGRNADAILGWKQLSACDGSGVTGAEVVTNQDERDQVLAIAAKYPETFSVGERS